MFFYFSFFFVAVEVFFLFYSSIIDAWDKFISRETLKVEEKNFNTISVLEK